MAHNRLSNYRTTWTETNGKGSVVYVHTPIVGVYQKNYEWFVDTPTGETLDFVDGMELQRV